MILLLFSVIDRETDFNPFSDPTVEVKNILRLKGEAHANRRRIWNRGMASESLRGYEQILAGHLHQLIRRFDEIATSATPELDMATWISWLAFDFMGSSTFGGGFNMLEAGVR